MVIGVLENKTCCVCGNVATKKHMSAIGQIAYYVCKQHYEETSPALGHDEEIHMNRMGLIWVATKKWIDLLTPKK